MNESFPDCIVTGHERLVGSLDLPDQDDRHVLAAAIVSNADAIVTFNTRDFPTEYVATYGVEVIDTDDFTVCQLELCRPAALSAAKNCRANLTRPAKTADEYADTLEKHGLPQTAAELRKYREFI